MQPRAIVQIRWGPLHGEKAILAPGGKLRVGRSDLADVAVPHDAAMSAVHFEL